MLAIMLHHRQWDISSMPPRPNSICALSHGIPNRPRSTKLLDIQPDLAKEGNSRVYSQTAKPEVRPATAPARVPCFQYMPPNMAGANWATAANEISPMPT